MRDFPASPCAVPNLGLTRIAQKYRPVHKPLGAAVFSEGSCPVPPPIPAWLGCVQQPNPCPGNIVPLSLILGVARLFSGFGWTVRPLLRAGPVPDAGMSRFPSASGQLIIAHLSGLMVKIWSETAAVSGEGPVWGQLAVLPPLCLASAR